MASATLEIRLPDVRRFDRVVLQEHIALGQRVRRWTLEASRGNGYSRVAEGTTIGRKRVVALPPTDADRLRLTVVDAKASPVLQRISIHRSPEA